MAEKLKYFINNQYVESTTDKYYELHNPSTGEVTGYAPNCTAEEVNAAIAAAKAAYPGWSSTPAIKRSQIQSPCGNRTDDENAARQQLA